MVKIHIDPENDGVRLDRLIRKKMVSKSLSEIYRYIRKGVIKVNGNKVKQNYRLKANDIIYSTLSEDEVSAEENKISTKTKNLIHTDFFKKNFKILFEDDSLLVCNKPDNIVVHSGTKHLKYDTLIDLARSYTHHSSSKKNYHEPILVHRLDKDTSGVILIAKNKNTLRNIHNQLRNNEIEKIYLALCHGVPSAKKGTIDISLVKTYQPNTGMKMEVKKGGQRTLSDYKVISSKNGVSLIQVKIHTGRTHQIRVHMAYLSCPIIGDVRYGDYQRDRDLYLHANPQQRLYLHAEQISFHHPALKRSVTFVAPIPEDFDIFLKSL